MERAGIALQSFNVLLDWHLILAHIIIEGQSLNELYPSTFSSPAESCLNCHDLVIHELTAKS